MRLLAALPLAASLLPGVCAAYTLEDSLRSIRARPADLALRPELVPDAYRLKIVERLMKDPAGAPGLAASVGESLLRSAAPSDALDVLSGLIEATTGHVRAGDGAAAFPPGVPLVLRGPLGELITALESAQREVDGALSGLTAAQRSELLDWAKLQLTDAEPDPNRLLAGETWLEKDEKVLALAGSVRTDRILQAGKRLLLILEAVLPRLQALPAKDLIKEKMTFQSSIGPVVLGSAQPEVFDGDAALIVDFGGDDVYLPRATAQRPGKVKLIIDLGGNDQYLSSGFGGAAGGVFGINVLVDAAGSDSYAADDAALGAGLFGLGVLWDLEGDDVYRGRSFTQGAGAFGVGMLIDGKGSDVYRASTLSQGAGYVKGAGLLLDFAGNDLYSAGFSQPDPRGYIESYGKFKQGEVFQSLSQGFATGWRDMAAGGVGLLVDGAGNDVYQADYFAQGAGYWLSWGMLYDRSGNDIYQARRYAQGAGVHFAVGTLLDASGNDRYGSWAVSQGCGHDYSLGILWDGDGDDAYLADWTAMGASNAMGVGILRDQGGRDLFITNAPGQSFWDWKRGAAGIGLVLHSGEPDNRYSIRKSTRAWNSTRWGAGLAQAPGLQWEVSLATRPEQDGQSVYEEFAAKDGAFLKARLDRAQGLGPRTRLSELLAVASGWGMNGSVPDAAKRVLLKEEPASALPLLLEWLNPKNVYARMNLEEYFFSAPEAARALGEIASSSKDPILRARACYYLGELRRPDALPSLIRVLQDPEWRVRVAAARALGFAQSSKFRGRLEKLAKLLDKPVQEPLQGWFSQGEKTETYAVMALAGLARADWSDLADGIIQETTTGATARKAAALAAANAGPLRSSLADLIARMARHAGAEDLVRALRDQDPEVRHWAAYSLGQLREEPEALARALEDADYATREAAADSLSQLGAAAVAAVKPRLGAASPELRALSYKALGGMEDKGVERLLWRGVSDKDGFVRLSALQSLKEGQERGSWKVRGRKLGALEKDDNPWVRDLAAALIDADQKNVP